MHILDFFLLGIALIVLVAIATARISGKLPNRGLSPSAQPHSMPNASDSARHSVPIKATHGSFKGILAHHDGPVQFLQPNDNSTP